MFVGKFIYLCKGQDCIAWLSILKRQEHEFFCPSVCVCVHVCVCVCLSVHAYMCVCVFMCVCVHILAIVLMAVSICP